MTEEDRSTTAQVWRRYLQLPKNVLALSFVALLNDTSSEIIYPLLPAFLALTLGATPFVIGLIEGLAESVASLLKLFSGYLSDRFDTRKWPVFFGYSMAAVTRPVLALVTSWPQVLVVRMADRMGKGIRGAPRDALLASSVPASERGFAFGFNRAADNLGAVLGPAAAYILLSIFAANQESPTASEYHRVFLFASVPVILGLFVVLFLVKEEKRPTHGEGSAPPDLSLKGFDANFKRLLVIVSIFTLSNSTDAFLLLRAQQTGIHPAVLPLLWMVLNFSKVASSLIGGHWSDKVGRKKVIFAGWIIYAAVYCGFAFVTETWQTWALFVVYGTYFGLTEGVEKALVADLVPDEKRGTAYGLYNLAFGITVFPASLIFGLIWWKLGSASAFLISAAISVLAATLLLGINTKPLRNNEKGQTA